MNVRLLALIPLDLKEMLDPFASTAVAAAIAAEGSGQIDAVILGKAPGNDDADAAFDAGATRVWLATHSGLASPADPDQLVAAFAEALSAPELDNARSAALSLLPAGGIGEEIAARLAMRTGGFPLGRCTSINFSDKGLIVIRSAYGGRAVATQLVTGGACFATMQTPRSEAAPAMRKDSGEIRRIQLEEPLPGVEHIRHKPVGERLAPIEGAKVVVCGGRGIGSAERFKMMEQLATCLGGAVGASLQAVDAGWAPVARQVGQSGKYVTADLYIGVGVSGTPQHMAGVSPDTRIVAINSDADADIFRFAEIGLVADWNEVLPVLIEKLKSPVQTECEKGL